MADRSATYGVLGVGAMGAAVVTGLCLDDPPPVVLSPRSAARSAELAARHPTVEVALHNQAVVDAADVVLVSVHPDQAEDVLAPLEFRVDQLVLSVVAGVRLAEVRRLVRVPARVVVSDPLPSVATRRGSTPVHPGEPDAVAFWERLGSVVVTDDERRFDALGVASATIAAHLEQLVALADWIAAKGVPSTDAVRHVAAVYRGVAAQLDGTPDLAGLVAEVATAGGFNEQLARGLREAGVPQALTDGLDAIYARLVSPGSRTGPG